MAKRGIGDHPKTLELAERLGIQACFAVGVLELFWHWVAKTKPQGDLSGIRPAIIAHGIRYSGSASELFDALVECGFLDVDGDRVWVHDWSEHADNAVHVLLRRRGENFADGQPPFARNTPRTRSENTECHDNVATQLRHSDHPHACTRPEPVPVPVPGPEDESKECKSAMSWREALSALRQGLPPPLAQQPEVGEALERFGAYMGQKRIRLWPAATLEAKGREMAGWSAKEIVLSADECIRNGWSGLYRPRSTAGGIGPPPGGGFMRLSLEDHFASLGR